MTSVPWWSNAVIYAVDTATFQDGNGDGVGDLEGLRSRLDYVEALGATCIWLLPFYASPNRDGRYDVVDHQAVDPVLGTRQDLDRLIGEIHRRGMRILVDLVASHTSDRHPWFEASKSGDAEYRDYYVWRDEPDPTLDVYPIFPGVSDSVWTYEPTRGQYYLHRFYSHEPDLNAAEPAVREEVKAIVTFWLSVGVDGFRLDAAPYVARKAAWGGVADEGVAFLGELEALVESINPIAVLVPEADVPPDDYPPYLEAGMHLMLDFWSNNHLFLALARRTAGPLRWAADTHAANRVSPHLVHWLRNHDELDLERLSEDERRDVFQAFGPTPREQIYGRGIRRRLPPMVDGDRAMVELATSIVFSLPGAQVLRYGEEIGMGDDLDRPERLAVRTAMQWSSEPGAGFSSAPPETWDTSLIASGPFGYEAVNVADQLGDPSSLLCWTRDLVRARGSCPEIGTTVPEVVDAASDVLALRYRGDGRDLVILHNLGREVERFPLRAPSTEIFPGGDRFEGHVELRPASTHWLVTG